MAESKERSLEEGRQILLLYLLCAFCARSLTKIEVLCFHLSIARFARLMEDMGVGSFDILADPHTLKIPFVDPILLALEAEGILSFETDGKREIIRLESRIGLRSAKEKLDQKLNVEYRVDVIEKSRMLGPAHSTVSYYTRCTLHHGRD